MNKGVVVRQRPILLEIRSARAQAKLTCEGGYLISPHLIPLALVESPPNVCSINHRGNGVMPCG